MTETKCTQCHMTGVHKMDCSYRARQPSRSQSDTKTVLGRVFKPMLGTPKRWICDISNRSWLTLEQRPDGSSFASLHDVPPLIGSGPTEAEAILALQSTLRKMAELEAWKVAYLEWQETAAKLIERLQSQLAWTPVSDGLPTEVTSIHDRENCPFCGSVDVDGSGSADFVHCNACGAFGPNGHQNWNKRAAPLRVRKVLETWLHQQVFMSENAPPYSAPYDAIGDLINELKDAYEKH